MQDIDNKKEITESLSEDRSSHNLHHSHHGHHHHHHHHHSHRHHTQKAGKKNKLKHFFRKNKKGICIIAIVLAVVLLLISVAAVLDRNRRYDESKDEDLQVFTEGSIQIEVPFHTEPVSIISHAVSEYLESDLKNNAEVFYKKYEKNGGRADIGVPFDFRYNIKGVPKGVSVEKVEILVDENQSFSAPNIYTPDVSKTQMYLYNLKTGTKYYYSIKFTLSNDTFTTAQGSFKTADTPRMLNIEGAANVRDIGGWKTTSGKTVRQGLLFRGSELDGAVKSDFFIKKEGIEELVSVLGIRTEMDLRSDADNTENTHPLGDNVNHIYYGTSMYSDIFSEIGAGPVRKVFSDLAVSSNYPVYLHCTYGMDRTGTICYLLSALLGVEKNDLIRDYQLSAFYYGSVNDDQMNSFIAEIDAFSGSTLSEKVENYLLSIGVTAQEIANIRNIFLG